MAFAALLLACLLAACNEPFSTPPSVAELTDPRPVDLSSGARTVIAIKPFNNPPKSPLGWSDVGPGMAEALSRKLLNQGDFDVRIQTALGEKVERALTQKGEDRVRALRDLGLANPEIDFAITGTVTDFHHTGEMSGDVARRGLLGNKINEAVAAIFINIVDLRTGLVRVSDHVIGTVSAGKTPVAEQYKDIAFGSYLFWSTPLGKASNEAIDRTIKKLRDFMPRKPMEILATRDGDSRWLKLAAGRNQGVDEGRIYWLCRKGAIDAPPMAIIDRATRKPIQVKITSVGPKSAQGWMMGVPPDGEDMRFLVVTPESPE
jgi:curli biogenesis system outer membrane secretion channel CsgG